MHLYSPTCRNRAHQESSVPASLSSFSLSSFSLSSFRAQLWCARTTNRGPRTMNILVEDVDIAELRKQRDKLLDFLNPSDEILGLINLLNYMLSETEDYEP